MRQKSGPEKQPAEDAIRDTRRATRRHFSVDEKIRIVRTGLRGFSPIHLGGLVVGGPLQQAGGPSPAAILSISATTD